MTRICSYCGALVGTTYCGNREFQDACIENLPGVTFACCGHGEGEWTDEDGWYTHCYVVFGDGITLYGRSAKAAMEMLGGNPPPLPDGPVMKSKRRIIAHYAVR